jgi:hypothetical protein
VLSPSTHNAPPSSSLIQNDSATVDALLSPIVSAIKPQVHQCLCPQHAADNVAFFQAFGLVNPLDVHARRLQNAQVCFEFILNQKSYLIFFAQPSTSQDHSAAQGVASDADRCPFHHGNSVLFL